MVMVFFLRTYCSAGIYFISFPLLPQLNSVPEQVTSAIQDTMMMYPGNKYLYITEHPGSNLNLTNLT